MVSIQEAQSNPLLFDKFIEENLRLVHSVVRKLHISEDYEDYFQIGCIGLVKSTRRFNPEFGTQFTTYAVPMIEGEIRRFRRDSAPVSRRMLDLSYKIYQLRQTGKSDVDICEELKISLSKLQEADSSLIPPMSLNEVIGETDHGDAQTLEYTLSSDINIEADVIESLMVKEKVQILKNKLSDDYFRIFALFLQGKTQTEIGYIVGIAQVQISRVLKKINELCNQINQDYETGEKTTIRKLGRNKVNLIKEVVKVEEVKFNKKIAEELLKDGQSPDYIASKFAQQFGGSARIPKMMMVKWGLVEGKPKPEPKEGGTKEAHKARKKRDKSIEPVISLKTEAVRGKNFRYDLGERLTISLGENRLPCEFSDLSAFIAELQQVEKIAAGAV